MHSSIPFDQFGGRFNAEQGQILTAQDVDRMGDIGLTTLLNFLALLFWDDENYRAMSGFPRERLTTSACETISTGALSFAVATGFGLYWNASSTPDDFAPHRYLPVVLDAVYNGNLAAHDATNPRIDLVCIAPAWESDVPESRNVKNPSTGVVSSTSLDARRRPSATIQVVTGTPAATPSAPAVPAGYMEIARATVPASTGSAVWEDTRAVLELGHLFKALPRYAVDDFVPLGGSAELEVTETSPASLAVLVNRGRACINGVSRFYKSETLTLSAAHATLGRIDLITATQAGALAVVTGTPHASPTPPAKPTGSIRLAKVAVAATVTSVSNANITDLRDREPFAGTSRLQHQSTQWDRLQGNSVKVVLGAPSATGDVAEIAISLDWPDGRDYDGDFDSADTPANCVFEVRIVKLFPQGASATSFADFAEMLTDWSSPTPEKEYIDTSSGDAAVWFVPASGAARDFNLEASKTSRRIFWMPSRTGTLKIERANGGTLDELRVIVQPIAPLGAAAVSDLITY